MREFVLHILERGPQRHFQITFFRAESVPNSAGLTKLIDSSEVDLTEGGAVQYVLNATNFAAALNQLNQQWANAESLGS